MPNPNYDYLFGCDSGIYKCGGIAPVKATDDMTQPVGQRNGQLFTKPGGSEIPDPSDLPDGKILTTSDGEWIADDAPDPLPLPGAAGNVLTSTGSAWQSADLTRLPTVSAANNGQVLMVVSGVWTAASLPAAEGEDF